MDVTLVNKIIQDIYASGKVVGKDGKVHELHSAIDPEEGRFIYNIIEKDPSLCTCLEIGCAYGLASLHICAALQNRPGATHTIIDPFQRSSWDGVGIRNLEDAGIDIVHLIEKKSEFALPELLADGEERFDFVFIDGWHTFDHTLLDCFYATRLLRKDGILVIDDVTYPAVRRVVEYLRRYPCYEESGSVSEDVPAAWKVKIARMLALPVNKEKWIKILAPTFYRKIFDRQKVRMIALRKTKKDERNWEWHDEAF